MEEQKRRIDQAGFGQRWIPSVRETELDDPVQNRAQAFERLSELVLLQRKRIQNRLSFRPSARGRQSNPPAAFLAESAPRTRSVAQLGFSPK